MADSKPTSPRALDPARPSRISERQVVSAPGSVIRVVRLRISEEQRAAVASALRAGRESVRNRR
jgi:hypothetical protein